jgi:AcrR family transcriptional regulator
VKQDRARRTHALLLDAAAVEFAAHGAAAGSLDRVAERTGLTKGALYGHFPSKAALVSELLAQFEAVWRELLHHADTAPGSALAALDRLLLELAQRLGDDPRFSCGMRLIVDAAQVEGQVPSHFPELRDRFTQLAVRAQQALRDPSAEVVGDTMLAILVGVRHTTPSGCPNQLVSRVTELRDALLTGRIRPGE